MNVKNDALWIGAIVLGVYLYWDKITAAIPSAVSAIPGAVSTAVGQGVESTLALFGVPETNATQCQLDIAAGKWWDASFSCPVGTFIPSAIQAMSTGFGLTPDANAVVTSGASTDPMLTWSSTLTPDMVSSSLQANGVTVTPAMQTEIYNQMASVL